MDRRAFMATAGAAAFATVYGLPLRALAGDTDAALNALLDKFFNANVDEKPEQATSLGLDKGARSGLKARLTPRSAAEKARRQAEAKDRLAQLKGIDRAG